MTSVVVGAGAVGLATARALTRAGKEVFLLDRAPRVASGTSSRNSGVIHAGLYYDRGSLKASTCIEGSWMLRRFCDMYKVPINKCGKMVVAINKTEDTKLQIVYSRATGLGARDIVLLDGSDARSFEPALHPATVGAIWSPHTAVLDAVKFCEAMLQDCVDQGKDRFTYAPRTEVTGIEYDAQERLFTLSLSDGSSLECTNLINTAGLYATDLTGRIRRTGAKERMIAASQVPKMEYRKGSYFTLKKKNICPFDRLIYPTRTSGHLGIHLTIDTNGSFRFGPNNEKLDLESLPSNIDATGVYDVDPMHAIEFREAIANYWPDVPAVDLFEPDYAGIRPKIVGQNDFKLDQHGLPGYVALYGVDSPGLTASLSLAHRVADALGVHGIVTPEMKSEHKYEWEI